jgi:hypothetical protein
MLADGCAGLDCYAPFGTEVVFDGVEDSDEDSDDAFGVGFVGRGRGFAGFVGAAEEGPR